MISHINGRLIEKTPTYVVIDCIGVGYRLNISLQSFSVTYLFLPSINSAIEIGSNSGSPLNL